MEGEAGEIPGAHGIVARRETNTEEGKQPFIFAVSLNSLDYLAASLLSVRLNDGAATLGVGWPSHRRDGGCLAIDRPVGNQR